MLTGGCRRTTSNRIAAMNAGRRHDSGNLLKLATRLSRKERDKREEVARGDKTKGAIVLVQPYISIQLVSQILPTSKICRRPEEDPENRNTSVFGHSFVPDMDSPLELPFMEILVPAIIAVNVPHVPKSQHARPRVNLGEG